MNIFQTLFYQPLLNALVLLYQMVPGGNLGLAIILLTAAIKILLYPLNQKTLKMQKALAEIEPRLKEVREKFKGDQEKIAKETMALYSEAKVNPLLSFASLFIQIPILFALYQVFSKFSVSQEMAFLYSFVHAPSQINSYFFTLNLALPNTILAFLAGIFFFLQVKFSQPAPQTQKTSGSTFMGTLQKQMNYFFPILSFIILLKVPAAIALYLITNSILSIVEAKYVMRRIKAS
jgi:YidC/Oxa1 family membrane protein insertase